MAKRRKPKQKRSTLNLPIGIVGGVLLVGLLAAVIFSGQQSSSSTDPPPDDPATPQPTPTVNATATTTVQSSATIEPTVTNTQLPTATTPSEASATPLSEPTNTSAPEATEPESPTVAPNQTIIDYTYKIINSYPHDPAAFTQGLIFEDNIFYEGTGLRGQSSLRKVDPESGQVLQIRPIADQYFGEGITIFEDRLIQLTWQARVGFVYNKDTFEPLQQFSYPTEGWGLTHDGERLIMSDGTANLYFLDPISLAEIGRVEVQDDQGPVVRLNELEYINGEVYANIWQTDFIVRIIPETGQVVGKIDLSGLLSPEDITQPVDVLNGIAYDAENDRLFVTGKLWPKLFEIELVTR
ncbi:MAG: glutaminyl-peptide cyclotransferase [Chloroflexota bacterium]